MRARASGASSPRQAATRAAARVRDWLDRVGTLIGLLPWALSVLIAWKEHRDINPSSNATANPGYFLVKVALWLVAGLKLAQGPMSGASDPELRP